MAEITPRINILPWYKILNSTAERYIFHFSTFIWKTKPSEKRNNNFSFSTFFSKLVMSFFYKFYHRPDHLSRGKRANRTISPEKYEHCSRNILLLARQYNRLSNSFEKFEIILSRTEKNNNIIICLMQRNILKN